MAFIGSLFAYFMKICFQISNNYGMAIILFTLLSKLILIPLAIVVQFNSIKMVRMYPELNRIKAKFYGSPDVISEENYKLYKKEKYNPILDVIPVIIQLVILMGVLEGLKQFEVTDTFFLGLDLSLIPSQNPGITFVIPVLAGLSAFFMCLTQNISNVLQSEQSRLNKISTMLLSVGLSLYLGFFVEAGVGLYWILGNLISIVQMYILNYFINPKKYVDYASLEDSKKELDKAKERAVSVKKKMTDAEREKEKHDYKAFNSFENKQVVFYSEQNGFYKYYKDIIEYILNKTDIIIHYVTSDINDKVFELESDNFRVYYVGENALINLMLKMDADIVVMTTPDLQKYHIKRSIVRKDVEYIYVDHGINSLNMVLRKHAIDYFDTIFAANYKVYDEIRCQEKVYNLKEKTIVKYGYALIDNMISEYESKNVNKGEVTIMVAPSWSEGNIMECCIDQLLKELLSTGNIVILRPHPMSVRHNSDKIDQLRREFMECKNFILQTDISSNEDVFNAAILVTDWSGIAYEYSFSTLRPCLYINTKMKIMNQDYKEIDVVPLDIEIRDEMGISVETDNLNKISDVINRLLNGEEYSESRLRELREKYLYNVGRSAEVGGRYIINQLISKQK